MDETNIRYCDFSATKLIKNISVSIEQPAHIRKTYDCTKCGFEYEEKPEKCSVIIRSENEDKKTQSLMEKIDRLEENELFGYEYINTLKYIEYLGGKIDWDNYNYDEEEFTHENINFDYSIEDLYSDKEVCNGTEFYFNERNIENTSFMIDEYNQDFMNLWKNLKMSEDKIELKNKSMR